MSGIPNYKSFLTSCFLSLPWILIFSILNAYPSIKTELNVTGLNSGKVSDNHFKIHKAVECLLSIQIVWNVIFNFLMLCLLSIDLLGEGIHGLSCYFQM